MSESKTTPLKEVFKAIQFVAKLNQGWWKMAVVSLAVFVFLIMVPVWAAPGNDFFFQLSLMGPWLVFLMAMLAVSNGMLIVMQGYVQSMKYRAEHVKTGAGATVGGLILSLVSAAVACSACYSAILSLFGLGATTFAFKYRFYIAIIALLVALYSLYRTSGQVNGTCEVCKIPEV